MMDLVSGKNFVIVDTETTGLSPENHEIIDLYAIEVHPSSMVILREDGGKIKPKYPELITPSAQACNGYTAEKWINAESFEAVSKRVWPLINGNTWIGSNPKFDIDFLRNAYIKCNLIDLTTPIVYLYEVDCIDTKDLAKYLQSNFLVPDLKLDTLCRYYGINQFESHTARGDCYRVLELLRRL